ALTRCAPPCRRVLRRIPHRPGCLLPSPLLLNTPPETRRFHLPAPRFPPTVPRTAHTAGPAPARPRRWPFPYSSSPSPATPWASGRSAASDRPPGRPEAGPRLTNGLPASHRVVPPGGGPPTRHDRPHAEAQQQRAPRPEAA